jgi:hypothetical protein
MSSRSNKRRVVNLFHGRFHSAFIWRSVEDYEWLNVSPVGREFGSPDYDRLMQQDHDDFMSNLSCLVDECRDSCKDSEGPSDPSDPDDRKDAVNVQIALHELGHDVSVAVAAAVWRHHSNSLMVGWMSGAETVASAKNLMGLLHAQSHGFHQCKQHDICYCVIWGSFVINPVLPG